MIPRSVKILILVHIGITMIGLSAHMILHPVGKSLFFWWASPVGFFSLLVVPVLYARPATMVWGYLFNAMTVAIGTIAMFYYFLMAFEPPVTLFRIVTESTLPKIFFLWTKLLVAHFALVAMRPLMHVDQIEGCTE